MVKNLSGCEASSSFQADVTEIAALHLPVGPGVSVDEVMGRVAAEAARHFSNDAESIKATTNYFYSRLKSF